MTTQKDTPRYKSDLVAFNPTSGKLKVWVIEEKIYRWMKSPDAREAFALGFVGPHNPEGKPQRFKNRKNARRLSALDTVVWRQTTNPFGEEDETDFDDVEEEHVDDNVVDDADDDQ